MKRTAVVMAAVLAAAVAVPLAACGGGGGASSSFRIENYAVPVEEGTDAWSREGSLPSDYLAEAPQALSSESSVVVLKGTVPDEAAGNPYLLYDIETGTRIGREFQSKSKTDASDFVVLTVWEKTPVKEGAIFDVFSVYGDEIAKGLPTMPSVRVAANKMFLGDTFRKVYRLEYGEEKETDGTVTVEKVIKYFSYGVPYGSEKHETQFFEAEEIEGKLTAYAGGSVVQDHLSVRRPLAHEDGRPTPLDRYELSYADTGAGGTSYSFFLGDNKVGSLELGQNDTLIGQIGTSLFYRSRTELDFLAEKGYNVLDISYSGMPQKFRDEYYRYDIAKGSLTKLKIDFAIGGEGEALYNYEKKTYDAACFDIYPFEDGVATVSSTSRKQRVILNENGKIIRDVSALPEIDLSDVVKLADGRFLANYASPTSQFLLDGSLQVIASFQSAEVYPSVQRIAFIANGKYGIADYDGKVVLSPVCSSLCFCGDRAYAATVERGDGTTETDMIVTSDGKIMTLKEAVGAGETDTVTVIGQRKDLLLWNIAGGDAVVCSLNGKRLKTVSADSLPVSEIKRSAHACLLCIGSSYCLLKK